MWGELSLLGESLAPLVIEDFDPTDMELATKSPIKMASLAVFSNNLCIVLVRR
jgi:hypothetical protein